MLEHDFRINVGTVELRENGDHTATVTGYAAVYYRSGDSGTEFEVFEDARERISPGAFDRAINENHDVRALINHDPSKILGRTTSGTLRLSTNRRGLLYEIDLPDTSAARDLTESIKRGDVSGSSFAFRATRDRWTYDESGAAIRELLDVDLFDVGPVTYPAYTGTTSAVRNSMFNECRSSYEMWKSETRGRTLAARLNAAIDRMTSDNMSRADIINDMASAAGISASTVNQILNAEINCPPLQRLSGFASVLDGVTASSLQSAAEEDGCEYGRAGYCRVELAKEHDELYMRAKLASL